MGIAASQPAEPSTENRAFVFIKVRPVACSHAAACSHKLSCGCAAARSHGGGAGACVEHAHKGWLQHPGRGPDCAPRSIQPFSAAYAAPDPFSAAHVAPDQAQTAPDLPSLPPAQDATIIDEKKLIDQHYYAIASKATILKPAELNVPAAKFKEKFGLEWSEALSKSLVFNAMDACKKLGVDAAQMASMWNQAKDAGQLIKFGGGFYCGLIEIEGKPSVYVFNGFFMSMRAKYTVPGESIYYYNVEWQSSKMSWGKFRGEFLGPTDPSEAPADSLRGKILANWEALGLNAEPNVGDNGVHASASPFEALAERLNWLVGYSDS